MGGRVVFIFSVSCFSERAPNFLVEVIQTLNAIYLIFKLSTDGSKVSKSMKALVWDKLDLNPLICRIWGKLLISPTFYSCKVELTLASQSYYMWSAYWYVWQILDSQWMFISFLPVIVSVANHITCLRTSKDILDITLKTFSKQQWDLGILSHWTLLIEGLLIEEEPMSLVRLDTRWCGVL